MTVNTNRCKLSLDQLEKIECSLIMLLIQMSKKITVQNVQKHCNKNITNNIAVYQSQPQYHQAFKNTKVFTFIVLFDFFL